MKLIYPPLLILILIFLNSCIRNGESDILKIDPRIFPEKKIVLSEIAGNVEYIPLENKFPIGYIYSYKFVSGYIYMAIKDIGVVRFTIGGKFDSKYGKIGKGPGEYIYFLKFAVDETSGSVYVMDHKMDDIEVYNSKGMHIRNIKLPKDDYGFGLSDIESQNSMLFFAQYINMGHGIYNWLITDTLGEIKQIKKNPYSAFKGRRGGSGGVFKHKKYIGYWDSCKDTIFKISPDLSYAIIGIFSPGEHRFPQNSAAYNSLETYKRNRDKYCMSYMFFETNNFFVYKYFLNGLHLALIDKKSGLTKSINLGNNKNGIINNIDGGIAFIPEIYYTNKKREYMVSEIHPFVIKAHVASEEFKNSTPKYPEKKKELEKLANSLNENDNPVLMLVKLKN